MPINIKTGTFRYLNSVYESEKNALIERIGFLSDSESESENECIEVKKEHAALQRHLAALTENERNESQESVLMLDGYRSVQDVSCPRCLVHTGSKVPLTVYSIDHKDDLAFVCKHCGLNRMQEGYQATPKSSVPFTPKKKKIS